MRLTDPIVAFLFIFFAAGPLLAQSLPPPNPNSKPVLKEGTASQPFQGASAALIYDIPTRVVTPVSLNGDDPTLPTFGDLPMNGARFDIPVIPGDGSFARVEFNNGATFCSATLIGPRHFLTAGHCVFDGGWRQNAIVYPGYSNGKPHDLYGAYRAQRFIAFSGWTQGGDYAHDIALIELPGDFIGPFRYEIDATKPVCQTVAGFDRHFYQETNPNQLLNSDGTYIGCKNNQRFYFLGNEPGSSGSGAVRQGTRSIIAVRSNYLGPVGFDSWITPAKCRFLQSRTGSSGC